MASNVARFDALRSLGFASISGTYAAVGTAFTHSMKAIRVINHTNGDMLISFDGITDNLILPAGSFVLYDVTSNEDDDEQFRIANRTQIFVKQSTAATSGSLYVEAMYARGE